MDIYYIVSALAGCAAVLSAIAYVFRHLRRFTRKVDYFFDDWYGKPARLKEGVPETKGVMLRLKDQDETLAYLKHELSVNSSHSVKDVVIQCKADIKVINDKLDVIEKRRTDESTD